jgi:hypothetical protein
MKKTGSILICLLLAVNSVFAQVSIQQNKTGISIKNEITEVRFNLDKGTYSAISFK